MFASSGIGLISNCSSGSKISQRGAPIPEIGSKAYYYRPQRSCGKVMFSQASVILFTRGGVYPSMHWGRHPTWEDTPPPDSHCSVRYASYWNAFLFDTIFAKNCMKMKEIGWGGGVRSAFPLDPPMESPMQFLEILNSFECFIHLCRRSSRPFSNLCRIIRHLICPYRKSMRVQSVWKYLTVNTLVWHKG